MDIVLDKIETTYVIRINEEQRKLYEQAMREFLNRHLGTDTLPEQLEFQAVDLMHLTTNRNRKNKLKTVGINDFTN